jgi:uncharacterized membrane protein YuzA (DUF378 family)
MRFIKHVQASIKAKGDVFKYLYSATAMTLVFAFLSNYAWGHWFSGSDLNFVQLIIRYGGLVVFLALPGMNEASFIAAGKGDLKTSLMSLLIRLISFLGLTAAAFVLMGFLNFNIFPGLNRKDTWFFVIYSPALFLPAFIYGILLSINKTQMTAIARVLTGAIPAIYLLGFYLLGFQSDMAGMFIFLVGISNLLLLLFLLKYWEKPKTRDRGTLKFGFNMSLVRWPEFAMGLEVAVLAITLAPIQLTLFFLADRIGAYMRSFTSNHFADAFASYCRIKDPLEAVEKGKKDCKGSLLFSPIYILVLLVLIPLCMVVWRQDYWGAIPICLGICLAQFLVLPVSFYNLSLSSIKVKRNAGVQSAFTPVVFLPALFIFTSLWGLWGVVFAKILAAVFRVSVSIYFWQFFTDERILMHHQSVTKNIPSEPHPMPQVITSGMTQS